MTEEKGEKKQLRKRKEPTKEQITQFALQF